MAFDPGITTFRRQAATATSRLVTTEKYRPPRKGFLPPGRPPGGLLSYKVSNGCFLIFNISDRTILRDVSDRCNRDGANTCVVQKHAWGHVLLIYSLEVTGTSSHYKFQKCRRRRRIGDQCPRTFTYCTPSPRTHTGAGTKPPMPTRRTSSRILRPAHIRNRPQA